MPWNAILFDVDDTLIDFAKSEESSLQKCHARSYAQWPYPVFAAEYRKINRALWDRVEAGTLSPTALGPLRFVQLAERFEVPYDPTLVLFYEQQLIDNTDWVEGAEELLTALKQQGRKIGFITNGFSFLQRGKYQSMRLNRYSDVLVISEEFGVSKPAPPIFLHALAQMGTAAHETLMVGDSLQSDGQGAANVGMPFCWYNPHGAPAGARAPDLIIRTLQELIWKSSTPAS